MGVRIQKCGELLWAEVDRETFHTLSAAELNEVLDRARQAVGTVENWSPFVVLEQI